MDTLYFIDVRIHAPLHMIASLYPLHKNWCLVTDLSSHAMLGAVRSQNAVFIREFTIAFTCDSNMNSSLSFDYQRRGSIRIKPQKASEIYHQLPKVTTSENDLVATRSHALI